jgi:hypothetical protein
MLAGLAYNGKLLTNTGDVMSFQTPAANTSTPAAAAVDFSLAPGPELQLGRALNIAGRLNGSQLVQVDGSTVAAHTGSGNGSMRAERFSAHDPRDPASSASVGPGGAVVLRSEVGRCWTSSVLLQRSCIPCNLLLSAHACYSLDLARGTWIEVWIWSLLIRWDCATCNCSVHMFAPPAALHSVTQDVCVDAHTCACCGEAVQQRLPAATVSSYL